LVALEPWRELSSFEHFAMSLSSLFRKVEADEPDAIAAQLEKALEAIGTAFGADECTLVTYDAHGEASVAGSWAASPRDRCTTDDLADMPWLLQRVVRGAVVAVTTESSYPRAAAADRAHAERTGSVARLAVPVVLGSTVCSAMMLGARRQHPDWNDAAAGRLRLVAEIVASGMDRLQRGEEPHPHSLAAVRHAEPLHPAGNGDGHGGGHGGGNDGAHGAGHDGAHGAGNGGIIGGSPAIRIALERLNQVAPLDITVLLCGETGTGKELFARAVHERSRRRHKPFIRVNCSALPPTLIESELFGHERGAFTGATAMRQGRFELADGGTLFLDEIGDLAPELQAKMLRALQEGEFERLGSSKLRSVDVRVVAATHVDLEHAVAEGRFRADLYYRLNVFQITLPPLRARRDDIPDLVWALIKLHQHHLARHVTTVPDDVMDALVRYDWPGNVRELENVIERGLIRSTGDTLRLDYPLRATSPATSDQTLDAVQRQHIEKVLRECGGRINGIGNAAVRLGLHPNTLRFRIKKLGVVVPGRDDVDRPRARPTVSASDPS
jgi:transcriptional regulator with GAF, ATPase, and Fis domain